MSSKTTFACKILSYDFWIIGLILRSFYTVQDFGHWIWLLRFLAAHEMSSKTTFASKSLSHSLSYTKRAKDALQQIVCADLTSDQAEVV